MKKVLIWLFSTIIFIVLLILSVSLSVKNIAVNTINKTIVSKEISDKVTDILYEEMPDMSLNYLENIEEQILNDESSEKITNKYFDTVIESIVKKKTIETPDIKEDLTNIVNNNLDLLKDLNIDVSNTTTEKIVNKIESSKVLNNVYDEVLNSINNNLTSEQKIVIYTYNYMSSNSLIISLIIILIVMTSLIAILKKSLYLWLINISPSLLVIGLFIITVIPSFVENVSSLITNKLLGRTATIDISSLISIGFVYTISGTILLLLYFIIKKIKQEE